MDAIKCLQQMTSQLAEEAEMDDKQAKWFVGEWLCCFK